MRKLLFLLAAAMCAACPTAGDATNVVDVCTQSGVQCRLGQGKLGVCTMSTAGSLDCVSQH